MRLRRAQRRHDFMRLAQTADGLKQVTSRLLT